MRLAVLLSLALLGCSDPVTGTDAARDVTTADVPRMDAAIDAPTPDLHDVPAGEVGLGASCSLNRECAANARCQCASGDCRCMEGPRGTGRAGGLFTRSGLR